MTTYSSLTRNRPDCGGWKNEEAFVERYQAEKEQAEKALEQAKASLKRAQAHLRYLKNAELMKHAAAAEDLPGSSES